VEDIIEVDQHCHLYMKDIDFSAIRAQGPGGQHVNKVSSAIHLRFDIKTASLPERTKALLLQCNDQRISKDGVIIIKAQSSRSQEQNKLIAIEKLVSIIRLTNKVKKARKLTRPTKASIKRRLESKQNRKQVKKQRQKIKI